MSPEESRIRDLLTLFPPRIIRSMIDDHNISFKSNKKSDLIDVLIEEVEWTDDEVEDLENRYLEFLEAESALGHWVCNVSLCPDLEELGEQLVEKSKAEFDDDGILTESGWDVTEIGGGVAKLNKWKYDEDREYDRLSGNIQESIERSSTPVVIYTNENIVRIEASNYQKAKGIRNSLEETGIEFSQLGHNGLHPDEAKERIEDLVEAIESELAEIDEEVQET
jgi:polyhydroxyalkanoate synthesis regulator phasin